VVVAIEKKGEGRRGEGKRGRGFDQVTLSTVTRSQALPGNEYPEALPPKFDRGRASRYALLGRA
jgi:hypothetical protein